MNTLLIYEKNSKLNWCSCFFYRMAGKKRDTNWRDEDMVCAMFAVKGKEMTIFKAAAKFNVSRKI